MSFPIALLSLIGGFVLLVKGADWLVDGAVSIARRFGWSELVIGLTIVAFGTSAPELIVNILASVRGNAEIAVGNIVGSNIANILLILGISAVVRPLMVQRSTVLKEIPFSLLAAATLFVMANDRLLDGYPVSELGRGDGLAFIGFFLIFLYYTFIISKNGSGKTVTDKRSIFMSSLMVIGGIVALTAGGKFCVDGAQEIARAFGISEALIGLTIVAVGTSLPELAASVVAAYKGNADIAVGNIVGSNIFNIFWILAVSSLIRPLPFATGMNFDLGVMCLSTLLLFFMVHNGHVHHRLLLWWKQNGSYSIRRWEGALLIIGYIAYVSFIVGREIA